MPSYAADKHDVRGVTTGMLVTDAVTILKLKFNNSINKMQNNTCIDLYELSENKDKTIDYDFNNYRYYPTIQCKFDEYSSISFTTTNINPRRIVQIDYNFPGARDIPEEGGGSGAFKQIAEIYNLRLAPNTPLYIMMQKDYKLVTGETLRWVGAWGGENNITIDAFTILDDNLKRSDLEAAREIIRSRIPAPKF